MDAKHSKSFPIHITQCCNRAKRQGYQQLQQDELVFEKITGYWQYRRRICCSACFLLVVLFFFFSSIFRPGPAFYNEEQLLKEIPAVPACMVVMTVSVNREYYKTTLRHLELAVTEPCTIMISEDALYWQQSDPLVMEYVNRNPNWVYAKHSAPIFGVFSGLAQWLERATRPAFDYSWVIKEIVIQFIVNACTVHYYDIFHFCFDRLNLPGDGMVMVLEDDIMIRHDAVQFSRWVSKNMLANRPDYWALSLRFSELENQAVYGHNERVRPKDNYDVFVVHHFWSTWGYALTRAQWDMWWHKGYAWWTSYDATLRKSMNRYDVPTVFSGLVRAQHIAHWGIHTSLGNCNPWGKVDLHASPVIVNYTMLNFSPRIRSASEPAVPSVKRSSCER
jgi:hypothetical protein